LRPRGARTVLMMRIMMMAVVVRGVRVGPRGRRGPRP